MKNIKYLVQINIGVYGGSQEYREVQQWVFRAICETEWRLCQGLDLHFSQWWWGACQNWWSYKHRKVPLSDFNVKSIRLETASFFYAWQWCWWQCSKHTWMEKHTLEHYKSWINLPTAWTSTLQHPTVWDCLDKECNKRQPAAKIELWMSFRKPGKLFPTSI